jgi:hypothetical protein
MAVGIRGRRPEDILERFRPKEPFEDILGKRGGRAFTGEQEFIEELLGRTTTGFEELLGRTREEFAGLQERGRGVLEESLGRRRQRLEELRGILGEEQERAFEESQPEILEDLERRGLLRSTDVGRAFAKERGRLEELSESALARQALEDVEFETGGLQELFGLEQRGVGAELGLGRERLGAELGVAAEPLARFRELADFRRQEKLAKELGEQAGKAGRRQRRTGLLSSLLGTGVGTFAGLGGFSALGRLFRGGGE